MFLNFDLLARLWPPYSYIYPLAEGLAGVLMVAGALNWISVPVALFIGTVGAASVFKAVYIDGRELKCARSEEHTSELQSLMRISYAVFCLKKKRKAT